MNEIYEHSSDMLAIAKVSTRRGAVVSEVDTNHRTVHEQNIEVDKVRENFSVHSIITTSSNPVLRRPYTLSAKENAKSARDPLVRVTTRENQITRANPRLLTLRQSILLVP